MENLNVVLLTEESLKLCGIDNSSLMAIQCNDAESVAISVNETLWKMTEQLTVDVHSKNIVPVNFIHLVNSGKPNEQKTFYRDITYSNPPYKYLLQKNN